MSPRIEEILHMLEEISSRDMDPHSGRMFGHIYETGDKELRILAEKAYSMYMWKNMLDPTVYPSIIEMERSLVRSVGRFFNLPEEGSGTFTYGGTESIIIAVLGARQLHRRREGASHAMKIVLPETAHPAFHKAAHLLGVGVKVVKVDKDSFTVNPENIADSLSGDVGMIVLSAPNYPFGTMDPVKPVAEMLGNRNIWLHVDNCIGLNLPFIRLEGAGLPPFDFELEQVYSISTDMHKYGYSPKNGSLVLFKTRELRKNTMFSYSRWAGYPLINTTILSSRSAGSLAAAWAVFNYLGEEGYRLQARRVLNARNKIMDGLRRLGYRINGEPVGGVFSFTSSEVNLFALSQAVRKRGWYIQAQPGSAYLGYEPAIHMTIAPIHDTVSEEFLKDLEDATREAHGTPLPPQTAMRFAVQTGLLGSQTSIEDALEVLIDKAGLDKGEIDEVLVNELIHIFPPEVVEDVLKEFIIHLYG